MEQPLRILGFTGSLRQGSYNRALLGAAKQLAPAGVSLEIFGLKPIPLYNADVEGITGSARGQSRLRQAFEFTNSYAMPQPELLVFRANERFDAQGRLTDETTRMFLQGYLAAFASWVRRFKT